MIKKLLILIFFTSAILVSGQNLYRFPALNSDGSKAAFSWQGDIWVAPVNGGQAIRLTVHDGYEGNPRWSPDDKYIAFSGDRFGNDDVYKIPADGGTPERLTYRSSGDVLFDWADDGRLLFTTARDYRQVEWESEIYSVVADGGTPKRIMDSFGDMPATSPDGRFIAFTIGACRITREEYTGPANRNVWVYDTKADSYTQISNSQGMELYPQWADNSTLYFLSAEGKKYNLNRVKISADGKAAGKHEKLTNYNDWGILYFSLSGDGKKAVFERDNKLFLYTAADNSVKELNISISADSKFDPYEHKTLNSGATHYSISPNGKYYTFSTRGEIFISENEKEKTRSVNVSNHPFRDISPLWLNDTTLIFNSDRNGQYDLYLVRSKDEKQSNIFKSFKHEVIRLTDTDEDESDPVLSNDGKKIAFNRGRADLIVAEIDKDGKISNELLMVTGWAPASGVQFSPDDKWLAYSRTDLDFNDEIFIHKIEKNAEPVNISMHPKVDGSPFWSKDGSKLGFASERSSRNNDIWFVWLNKKDWEKTKADWDEKEEEPAAKGKDKKDKDSKDSTKVKEIVIDIGNIHERLVQVTNSPNEETQPVISSDGETFYFVTNSSPGNRDRDLFSIKWDGKDLKQLTKGGAGPSQITLDKDGKNLYYLKSMGKLAKLDVKSEKEESLPFSAKMKVDFAQEKEQIFEEAWRALNNNFYDPDFHGKNWDKLKKLYKPKAMMASTITDFRSVFNWMLGEINASHMGMYGSDIYDTQKENTGLLGVEIEPLKEGVKVSRVIPESPASKSESKLETDDIILAVNGNKITNNVNFYSLFVNTAGEKVLLNVKNKSGDDREVVIRPVSSVRDNLYEEWVSDRSALVEKYSNGKLGYLHIQGMDMPSFEKFERDLTAAGYGKDGIVIDVRYNGGGWTTDYLMTVLNVRQHAYTIPRGASGNLEKDNQKYRENYPYGERLPYAAWTKPSVAMCNSMSYSNAEIFSHAYQTLGLGKLVGEATFGAVISTGGQGLLDGSYVRIPFRAWYVKATGMNMENGPAVPDIIVDNAPDSKARGEDPQLKRAVEELLKDIK